MYPMDDINGIPVSHGYPPWGTWNLWMKYQVHIRSHLEVKLGSIFGHSRDHPWGLSCGEYQGSCGAPGVDPIGGFMCVHMFCRICVSPGPAISELLHVIYLPSCSSTNPHTQVCTHSVHSSTNLLTYPSTSRHPFDPAKATRTITYGAHHIPLQFSHHVSLRNIFT